VWTPAAQSSLSTKVAHPPIIISCNVRVHVQHCEGWLSTFSSSMAAVAGRAKWHPQPVFILHCLLANVPYYGDERGARELTPAIGGDDVLYVMKSHSVMFIVTKRAKTEWVGV
jgi:hypothetical protein